MEKTHTNKKGTVSPKHFLLFIASFKGLGHPMWNIRTLTHPALYRYGVAVFAVVIAFFIKYTLDRYVVPQNHFIIFFAAITISAWYGGLRSGLFATILSAILVDYFFLHNQKFFGSEDIGNIMYLTIFIFEGTLISLLSQIMHTALWAADLQRREIIRNEERFRLIFNTVTDYAIYTLDNEGYIITWNEGAARLKGYETHEVIGKHFSLFYPKEEVEKSLPWKDLAQTSEKGHFVDERIKVRKDGTQYLANITITAMRDEKGKLRGFSHISHDITERKIIEKRKDEFIGMASHELKTPLTSIKVFTQILQKMLAKEKNTKAITYLLKMSIQIEKITNLINDLLDVSKMQQGNMIYKKELLNIQNVIQETVESLQNLTINHALLVEKSNKIDFFYGNNDRIGQVITNLITNAIKYSPNSDKIIIRVTNNDESLIVAVQDFGIGIPEEHQEKIFERFYRVYYKEGQVFPGLGMGLYISSEIIRQHGGKMWVESKKEKGSTFYFSLPASHVSRVESESVFDHEPEKVPQTVPLPIPANFPQSHLTPNVPLDTLYLKT